MGHERIGYLPRSKKWNSIIEDIGSYSTDNDNVSQIAQSTTKNVRARFNRIGNREYLIPPIERLKEKICAKLLIAIPEAYDHEKPKHENALNDLINAVLMSERNDYEREFPYFKFSISKTIPDLSYTDTDLLIEAKYLRKNAAKSAITDGIAADLTKYPDDKYKLFIVYDPERRISSDNGFKRDFEDKPDCTIQIIR